MRAVRTDNRGRILQRNENQLKNGSYTYRYFDEISGKRKCITSWRLLPEDESPDPEDERDCLRNLEIRIEKTQKIYRRKLPKPGYTVNDYWEKYLSLKCEVAESTLVGYIYLYNRHIRNELGKRLVTALRASDIKRFYIKKLGEEKLSIGYADTMSKIIEPVLELAVKDGIIDVNPARGVMKELRKRKDWTPKTREALTEKEQINLINFVSKSFEYKSFLPYLTIFLGTGLRCGELIGLTWDDIDFENNVIDVNHTLNYKTALNGKCIYYITYPKSRKGMRKIPMLKEVREVFEELYRRRDDFNRDYQPAIDGYTGFIFRDLKGNIMSANRINRALKNIVRDYNEIEDASALLEERESKRLPVIGCHHLRHTFCTRLIENNVSIKTVQYLMGHHHASTTVKIYLSISDDRKKDEMQSIEGKMKLK